ncbi:MAG: hypothetical protein M1470_12840 [Bacteroidetes bacterium]|nr:hypothetical protein [Bacteroidota bacterium]
MSPRKRLTYSTLALVLVGLMVIQSYASEPASDRKAKLSKLGKTLSQILFTPNNIQAYISNNGILFNNQTTGNAGLIWPAGSGKTAVFTAGLWVIGKSSKDRTLHTAVSDYSTEYQPGPIVKTYDGNANNAAADAANPTDSKWNIMVLSKSTPPTDPTYQQWASGLVPGAPMTPDGKPLVLGDEAAYWVMNDLNVAGHNATGTTTPMGLEVQNYLFGFNQSGAMGNILFLRMRIINKSNVTYDSTFVGWFSDIDLGNANDDNDACDTTLSLGYTYNGAPCDAIYGCAPPADGYVFFEGPKVPGTPADSAIVSGKWTHGYKNLPMTSYAEFVNGGGIYNDPPLGNVLYPTQAYNLLNGLIGVTGQPFIDPTTGKPSKFVADGNPVTGQGWQDPVPVKDKRLVMGSGPFTLLPGDTQEVVVGFVIGQGTSNLNSITVLKDYTQLAQLAFNVNFQLASPPPPPNLAVGQLNNKIVLTWDNSDESFVAKDTLHQVNGHASDYTFEGYNVYQTDGPSIGPSSQIQRLATYDIVDSITKIWDFVAHPELGENIYQPVEFGTNSGIQRYYTIDKNAFTGNPLHPGTPYYFAVTAYAYNPFGSPKVLETPLSSAVQAWIPMVPAAGTSLGAKVGVTNFSSNRPGDDAFYYQVINPDSLNGNTYRLSVDSLGPKWSLFDLTTNSPAEFFGQPVVSQTGTGATYPYPIVNGIMPILIPQSPGIRGDKQTPPGYAYSGKIWFAAPNVVNNYPDFGGGMAWPGVTPAVYDANLAAFPGVGVSGDSLIAVKLIFSSTNTQRVYRYVDRWNQNIAPLKAKDSSFLPYLINSGTAYPYQDYQKYPLGNSANGASVPFTAWSADYNDHGRQLNVGLLEHNDSLYNYLGKFLGRGNIDGKWNPLTSDYGGGGILMIFKSTYSDSALPQYTVNNFKAALQSGNVELMYLVWVRKDSGATFQNGDTLTITPNYPLIPGRSYVFTAPKTLIGNDSVAIAQDAISQVQVFPNPYFGYNPLETNSFVHFVTFSHLPKVCTIRVFSLDGVLLRTINHSDPTGGNPFERWDLTNSSGLPVASGMYIAYIDAGKLGVKILKLAVIQPQQRVNKL